MNLAEADAIPGMIEPVERQLLYRLAQSIAFEKGDSVAEFGTFFGRSTNCIAQGLAANPSYSNNGSFFAYDSFECEEAGGFSRYVRHFAQQGSVSHLIRAQHGKIDFLPVFEHFLRPYIDRGIVTPVKSELTDSVPQTESIVMMHIDSPKFYSEFKTILFRFFPRVKTGSVIVFQDFFYHWSASLAAAVEVMMREGYLEPMESAATALACRVLKPVSEAQAVEIDRIMHDESLVPGLIDTTVARCSRMKMDRPEIFLPRLLLAKMQWLFERERHRESSDVIAGFLASGGQINPPLAADFREMLEHGFSIRKLYEKDHNIEAVSA